MTAPRAPEAATFAAATCLVWPSRPPRGHPPTVYSLFSHVGMMDETAAHTSMSTEELANLAWRRGNF